VAPVQAFPVAAPEAPLEDGGGGGGGPLEQPARPDGPSSALIVGGAIGFMLLAGLVIYGFSAKKPKRRRRR
jgi:hypothetical protein